MPGQAGVAENEQQHDDAEQFHPVGHDIGGPGTLHELPERIEQNPDAEAEEEGGEGSGRIAKPLPCHLNFGIIGKGDDQLRIVLIHAGEERGRHLQYVLLPGRRLVGDSVHVRAFLLVQCIQNGIMKGIVIGVVRI